MSHPALNERPCRTCRSAPAREATEGGSRVCAGCRLTERRCVCPPSVPTLDGIDQVLRDRTVRYILDEESREALRR